MDITTLALAKKGTLKEPSSGIAVGKYFRVASIDSNGHPILEYADGSSGGSDKVFIATYNSTTATEVASALTSGKIVVCNYVYTANDKHWLALVDETDSKYVFTEASIATSNGSTAVSGISAALNKTTNAWEVVTGGASIPTFPATTENGKYLHTNATTGALEWVDVSGGSWGGITGTLANQTDLQTALDAKQNATDNNLETTAKTIVGAINELKQSKVDKVTITVTCVTQDGVTVTGQTVYLRDTDASGTVIQTASYNGQPITFEVAKDFAYHISVTSTLSGHFNPTTASGVADSDKSVILTYSDTSHITTFADLPGALESGLTYAELGGLEIADTWTAPNGTVYSNPMVVMDVKSVEDEDGETHNAVILCRKYASSISMQFDAPEQASATGETFASGTYYYQNNSGTWSLLVEGTDYQVGDTVGDNIYKNSIRDTTINLIKSGYNRYRDSGVRQWLLSDDDTGAWWESTHTGDVAPSQLASTYGYKKGCTSALLNAIKPIKIQCYTNSVTDGSAIDTMYDDLWLPSGTELYGSVNDNEGTYIQRYKDRTGWSAPSNSANEGRIHYAEDSHSSAQYVWLRSADRSYSYYAWYCRASGYLGSTNANNSYRCVPACAIY